jgi:hypothetical protein
MNAARAGALLMAALAAMAAPASAQTRPAYPGITCNLYGPRHFCDQYQSYGIGQDLRLTVRIKGKDGDAQATPPEDDDEHGGRSDEIDNISALFRAFRACWVGPPADKVRRGMQITIRFSLNRDGNIIGAPHLTYVTKGVSDEDRQTYYKVILEGLNRYTPFHLTKGMGGAIAGRPLIIRYIETRRQGNAGGDDDGRH